MAGQAGDYHRGDMDIHEQQATFHLVMGITKWGSMTLAAVVAFLVIWFCTSGGFVAGLVTAIVITALGVTFLRSRPEGGH
jgi:hypothetical protein